MVSVASSAFTSAYPLRPLRQSTAPSLRRGSVVRTIPSTMGRSDSRSALLDFVGSRLIRVGAPKPPAGGSPPGRSRLGRRRVSPVPTFAVSPFHVPYAVGFLGVALPSASPLPWPSPTEAG